MFRLSVERRPFLPAALWVAVLIAALAITSCGGGGGQNLPIPPTSETSFLLPSGGGAIFPAGSFDGALALASLSHIREPEQAIRNLATLLRPGGRLYVFEDNNSSHPGYAKNMSPIWEGAETGRYPDGVPSEKKIPESYLDLRKGMIRGRFPGLPAESVDRCARETRGLHGRRVFEAVEEHRAGREIVNPRMHLVCHPVSGEFEEYPLNPALVKGMLKDAGFEPRLRSPHTGPFRGRFRLLKRAAAGILSLCPALLPWTSPTFSVVAERRAD